MLSLSECLRLSHLPKPLLPPVNTFLRAGASSGMPVRCASASNALSLVSTRDGRFSKRSARSKCAAPSVVGLLASIFLPRPNHPERFFRTSTGVGGSVVSSSMAVRPPTCSLRCFRLLKRSTDLCADKCRWVSSLASLPLLRFRTFSGATTPGEDGGTMRTVSSATFFSPRTGTVIDLCQLLVPFLLLC